MHKMSWFLLYLHYEINNWHSSIQIQFVSWYLFVFCPSCCSVFRNVWFLGTSPKILGPRVSTSVGIQIFWKNIILWFSIDALYVTDQIWWVQYMADDYFTSTLTSTLFGHHYILIRISSWLQLYDIYIVIWNQCQSPLQEERNQT